MKTKLIMRYPTSWHQEMWREGAPFGNGIIGGLVYGGIYKEKILINHALLWRGGKNDILPDISDHLGNIRRLLDERKVQEADGVITNALREKGYHGEFVVPTPLADILIETPSKKMFSHYRREIDLERALITVSWREDDSFYKRETFVSRADHRIYTRYSCENGTIDTKISVGLHDPETLKDTVISHPENFSKGDYSFFAAYNDSIYKSGDYGIVCKVVSNGKSENEGAYIHVKNATEILLVAEVFIEKNRKKGFQEIQDKLEHPFEFYSELDAHCKIHSEIFHKVDFEITENGTETSNEELLLDSFEESSSNELIEKLYAYGRYLFICSTDTKDTLPCHLTGLFNGTYQCLWAFYMYNVNFQMIYWQALSGNMPEYLRLALDYTEKMIPDFRENAKRIFGCRGILINSVNAPDSGLHKCLERHIVNWTGGAAWFAQHFYDYYRFTLDLTYLKEHAMPFMYEAALFYEDFAVLADDGYLDLYPSVSPENTPDNILKITGMEIETSKNATMEIALLKELLTNLLEAHNLTGLYSEKIDTWKEMLKRIRPYMINDDGAIKEWCDSFYEDHYCHRHHSHLYPIFPGNEITKDNDLYPAFVKAEDLRLQFGLSDQSSWSMVFMAGIAARMGRGDLALKEIDAIGRTCLMNNFFTVHNDWRRMGPVACADFRSVPFQIDGNIGIPGVINEMILQSQNSTQEESKIVLLPALPLKWAENKGHILGLLARGNINCDIFWNKEKGYAILRSLNKRKVKVSLGENYIFLNHSPEMTIIVEGEYRVDFYQNRNNKIKNVSRETS